MGPAVGTLSLQLWPEQTHSSVVVAFKEACDTCGRCGELSLLRIAIRIFPVSSVTITNPSEMRWNPLLSLKKGEKTFLNKICSDYPCFQGKEYSAIQEIATA